MNENFREQVSPVHKLESSAHKQSQNGKRECGVARWREQTACRESSDAVRYRIVSSRPWQSCKR